jgi:hypothetical protein
MKTPSLIKTTLLILSALIIAPLTQAAVIPGPAFAYNLSGWGNSGLQITAVQNTKLVSVVFNSQGQADTVQVLDNANSIIASVSVPAGGPAAQPSP